VSLCNMYRGQRRVCVCVCVYIYVYIYIYIQMHIIYVCTYILYVQGATSHYITSEDEVQQALEVGGQARATAETFMNQECVL
jgi:hypothetical protein